MADFGAIAFIAPSVKTSSRRLNYYGDMPSLKTTQRQAIPSVCPHNTHVPISTPKPINRRLEVAEWTRFNAHRGRQVASPCEAVLQCSAVVTPGPPREYRAFPDRHHRPSCHLSFRL